MGVAEIQSLADELGVSVTADLHSMQNVDSQDGIRDEIVRIVEQQVIDTVIMGYGENPFEQAAFRQSTAHAILETHETPVVLVP